MRIAQFMCNAQFMRIAQFMCNAQFMRRKAQFIRGAGDVVLYKNRANTCAYLGYGMQDTRQRIVGGDGTR